MINSKWPRRNNWSVCLRSISVLDKRGVSGQKPNKAGNVTWQNKRSTWEDLKRTTSIDPSKFPTDPLPLQVILNTVNDQRVYKSCETCPLCVRVKAELIIQLCILHSFYLFIMFFFLSLIKVHCKWCGRIVSSDSDGTVVSMTE